VIDLVLAFGTNSLFQIGLALLSLSEEKKILKIQEEGEKITGIIFDIVQDGNLLIEIAFSRFAELPIDSIEAMRKQKTAGLVRNLQESVDENILNKIISKYPSLKKVKYSVLLEISKQITDMSKSKAHNKSDQKGIDAEQFQQLIYNYVPQLGSSPERNAGIVALCFNSASKEGVIVEEEFLKIFAILYKGSLVDQFNFCYNLICPHSEDIKKAEFRSVLDILLRISFEGDTPPNVIYKRLDTLVEIVFEKLRGHQDILNYTQIKEMILDQFLLEGFWTQLYYE